jgi:3-deoxy-D-manno-octulosonic-acid transferase
MLFLYNIAIRFYYLSILFASLFNKKARFWIRGRKDLFERISSEINPDDHMIWFHCSSLGEFEQGRPVIEKIREKLPDRKILLTFFSPSGYEIRKNYTGADYIYYLPSDTRKNAKKLLDLIHPEIVFFVKYEYWYHYLSTLHKHGINTYLISGKFRPDQVFFRRYGKWFRKMLRFFHHFFIQDEDSASLLKSIGINNFTVSGDTRFDRVYAIARKASDFPSIRKITTNHLTLIAGSTWPEDEDILVRFMNENKTELKYIIVPHEIHERNIRHLQGRIQMKTIRYSSLDQKEIHDPDVLIIDTIGILSSIYQYGSIAYIGGGFGKGIHNTLEAAIFGLPVIFGPNYKKFREAAELINHHGGFSINDYQSFSEIVTQLIRNKNLLKTSGENARNYVRSGFGATDKIINFALTK